MSNFSVKSLAKLILTSAKIACFEVNHLKARSELRTALYVRSLAKRSETFIPRDDVFQKD